MLKRAALQLATLAPMDRSWLLSQLSLQERERLQPLIDEVITLGMHQDPAVLDALSFAPTVESVALPSEATPLADVLAGLPGYWREIASGQQSQAGVEASEFLNMLGNSRVSAAALRKAIVEIAAATHGAAHA